MSTCPLGCTFPDDGVLRRDLVIVQGATWFRSWRVKVDGIDMDGTWVARALIRRSIDDPAIAYTFTVDVSAAPVLTLPVPHADSSAWSFTHGVYDVKIEDTGGRVVRVLKGCVNVSQEVTR